LASDQHDKSNLVTGGSSGIGLGIAKKFAAMGYKTAINSFEPEADVKSAIDELKSVATNDIAYLQADLSNPEAAFELVQTTIKTFGRIDVLVNNAGIQKVSPIEDFPPQDWARIRAIMHDAPFRTMRAAIPDMDKRGWGRIITVASAHGLVASPFKSAYVAAKHGVLGLTKTVALETAERGITVNAICPGYVWTPLVEKQLKDQAKTHNMSEDEVVKTIMLTAQPTKKFVQIEEVSELAAYLASDFARSITGTSISVDGGWTAQ
jgi:3-hydroxybutyrate dehydrogenase